jgi:hypothetical protein
MRNRLLVGGLVVVIAVFALPTAARTAAATRKPLGRVEREAVLALIKAVELAQSTNADADPALGWDYHIFKSTNFTGYVPFTLRMAAPAYRSAAMYVRAVSRHDGMRSSSEQSYLRDWLLNNRDVKPRQAETVYVGIGEMPLAGLAGLSTRQATAAAAAASASLALQQKDLEKQQRAAAEAKRKAERRELDPLLFPFEEYFFVDLGAQRGGPATVARALALPPGEYDIYVGLIDRARVKTSSAAVLHQTLIVPDFWSDRLAMSSLLLARDVRALKAALAVSQQVEHPYTFGAAEVVPAARSEFDAGDVLTVVYQVCNYGAPDSDVTANYTFFRVDGGRRLFNRTDPQQFTDADLPPAGAWESQTFVSQAVPLQPFPPGQYELEVQVRDRLTRASVKAAVAFTVTSGLR